MFVAQDAVARRFPVPERPLGSTCLGAEGSAYEAIRSIVVRSILVKVVHVIGAMIAGGAERFVASLATKLKIEGVDVRLWVLSNRRDEVGQDAASALSRAGVSCESGPSARIGWATVRWYARQLASDRPTIVHLHTPNTELAHFLSGYPALDARFRKNLALIRTIHNTEVPSNWIVRRAYRKNRASCSIGCGAAVAAAYKNLVSGQLTSIQNGVDFSYPIKSRESTALARTRLGIEQNGFHAIHIGRMGGATPQAAQKAHDVLLDAWRRSGIGTRGGILHLLGDGNLREQLMQLASGDPSIRFHGVSNDVHSWLQAADCFLMPSRFEGLPIAAIEAVGAGLPCLFSDIAPLRELAPPLARWCGVNDAASLARELGAMFDQAGLPTISDTEKFRERYSIEETARQYLQVYRHYARAT
jgi:glycosyltransferase involved in cell wall biosynthesis